MRYNKLTKFLLKFDDHENFNNEKKTKKLIVTVFIFRQNSIYYFFRLNKTKIYICC